MYIFDNFDGFMKTNNVINGMNKQRLSEKEWNLKFIIVLVEQSFHGNSYLVFVWVDRNL